MNYKAELCVTEQELSLYNELLSVEPNAGDNAVELLGYPEDSTIKTLTVVFENGYFADLKLCSGQSNFFGDSVLFNKNGFEVCCLDCFDSLDYDDTFTFETNTDTYVVTITK